MKNLTAILIALFIPFFPLLNAQCFDLSTNLTQVCPGDLVEVNVTISGGEAPYSIAWTSATESGNGIVADQNGVFTMEVLESPTYHITVTDNTNCTETTLAELDISNSMTFEVIVNPSGGCGGECNGAVQIIISGGVPPYQYSWLGANIIINNAVIEDDLCPGNYQIVITDSFGCRNYATFVISDESNGPEINVEGITHVFCPGNADGAIDIEVYFGQAPFIFLWTGPNNFTATTEDISNLEAGIYTLEMWDANNCFTGTQGAITEPEPMVLDYTASGVACMEEGFIQINSVVGGEPPYSFELDGIVFANQTFYENLTAGSYVITVLDANDCAIVETITIESEISMELNSTFADCNLTGGTVTATLNGGASDPVFVWSNGQTGPELVNVGPGWYSVTVSDNLTNCVNHQNVEVLWDPDCYAHISGYVFIDRENADCLEDASSEAAKNILVKLSNGALTFTNALGYYEFETKPGAYEISVDTENTFVDPLCADPISVNVSDFGDHSIDNIFWVNYPDIQDLAVSVAYGAVRPGFEQKVVVHAHNHGGYPMNGTLHFSHDLLQTLITSQPSASNYDLASATLSWDFENLNPGASMAFILDLHLPQTIALGTPILYTAKIEPDDNDINLANNHKEIDLIVTGSYDPNDKQVSPRGEGNEGYLSESDSLLTYQVRFQNTGTDTAFTVVILDQIEEDLDISTIRPGASSHPYELNVLEGNVLEFRFENIMLPDSFVNEAASNAYVLFDIKTKRNSSPGTVYENTAAIYFDFNEPIITNTVVNTLRPLVVSVNETDPAVIPTKINPNPGGNESILTYTLNHPSSINLALYDINGRLIRNLISQDKKASGRHQLKLDGADFPKGVYLIHLETTEGMRAVQKWIKIE